MMTLYLIFEALERGKIKITTPVRFSANAAAAAADSKLGVQGRRLDHGRDAISRW